MCIEGFFSWLSIIKALEFFGWKKVKNDCCITAACQVTWLEGPKKMSSFEGVQLLEQNHGLSMWYYQGRGSRRLLNAEGLKKGDIFAPDNPLGQIIGQLLSHYYTNRDRPMEFNPPKKPDFLKLCSYGLTQKFFIFYHIPCQI